METMWFVDFLSQKFFTIYTFFSSDRTIFFRWQTLVGAIIGASTPFLLWWFTEVRSERKAKQENLYFLHRIIVDQINTLLDIKKTIQSFVDTKLTKLIEDTREDLPSIYSVDMAFFPLFSARPIADEIHLKPTGSAYVDNMLSRAYKVSQDLPYIIDDLRRQFTQTLDFNKEISFNKLNSAETQRRIYLGHLQEYRRILITEMLEKNIPIFLNILVSTLVSIVELRDIGLLRWRLKFDSRYKFFISNSKYLEKRKNTFDNIENYFKPKVEEQLKEIQEKYENS